QYRSNDLSANHYQVQQRGIKVAALERPLLPFLERLVHTACKLTKGLLYHIMNNPIILSWDEGTNGNSVRPHRCWWCFVHLNLHAHAALAYISVPDDLSLGSYNGSGIGGKVEMRVLPLAEEVIHGGIRFTNVGNVTGDDEIEECFKIGHHWGTDDEILGKLCG